MESQTKEYITWQRLRDRCFNINSKDYKNYGGRGINVCERWLMGYKYFLQDMGRAPTPKHQIERVDNNGNYEPSNCKWATRLEQANNLRCNKIIEYKGERKTLAQWCRQLNINYDLVQSRLSKYNWSIEDAFEKPRYGGKRNHWGRTPANP